MALHPLTNFEIQYYQKEPKFYSLYSKNNLLKTTDGAYLINLNKNQRIGTYWIDLFVNANNIVYFHSLGVEHIPNEIKKFLMLKGKSLLDYTNLFYPNDYEKNDKMILKYFQ